MKAICCGDALTRRLAGSLAGTGVEVLGASDASQALAMLKQQACDLALVDASQADAGETCRALGESAHVPVVVIARGRNPNWTRLQSLEADGYVLESHSGAEMAARFRAVVRRRIEWRVQRVK